MLPKAKMANKKRRELPSTHTQDVCARELSPFETLKFREATVLPKSKTANKKGELPSTHKTCARELSSLKTLKFRGATVLPKTKTANKKGELARALLFKITPKFRGATVLPKTLTNKKKRRTPELKEPESSPLSFFHSQTLTPF